jgi:hypothetical protein
MMGSLDLTQQLTCNCYAMKQQAIISWVPSGCGRLQQQVAAAEIRPG